MMKNFSDIILTPITELDERTILIQNIPESKRKAELLKKYIEAKFDGVLVTRVTFTYDIEMLKNLTKQIIVIESARHYCQKYKIEYGRKLLVSPHLISRYLMVFDNEDGIKFYLRKRQTYRLLLRDEVASVINDPKHAVFVQLKNEHMARRFSYLFDNILILKNFQ